MITEKYTVGGMHCAGCSSRVERLTRELPGVTEASVNLLTGILQITYDETKCTPKIITDTVIHSGYTVSSSTAAKSAPEVAGNKEPDATAFSPVTGGTAISGAAKTGGVLPKNGDGILRPNPGAMDSAPASTEDSGKTVKSTAAVSFATENRFTKNAVIINVVAAALILYIAMVPMLFPQLPVPSFWDMHRSPVSCALSQCILAICVLFNSRKLLYSGARGLYFRSPNMDSLVLMGTGAAFIYSVAETVLMIARISAGTFDNHAMVPLYYESTAVVLTLIMAGKLMEARSKQRTGEAIRRLMSLAPETAVVIRNGKEETVPVESLRGGDTILVRPGTAIPADGTVVSGVSTVDESMLTGESVPVVKEKDSTVTGGTMNAEGTLTILVTGTGENSTLAKIVQLMTDAQGKKAPIARIADTVSYYFVPAVFAVAVVAAVVWLLLGYDIAFVLKIFVSILVIACPCSLGLATPTAVMVATGRGASKGILFKSGEALEKAGRVTAAVFDKTGTITAGKPSVTTIVPATGIAENELLQTAASVEYFSKHPLAAAITAAATQRQLELLPVRDFAEVPGKGVRGTIQKGNETITVCAGNAVFMQEVCTGFSAESAGQNNRGEMVLYTAINGVPAGTIYAEDKLNPAAAGVTAQLQKDGVDVYLLSGDNRATAEKIAAQAGIVNVIAEVLPGGKAAVIRQLQEQHTVMMIGDGINDAPALAQADCGAALGTGSDIARESGNIVLLSGGITTVPATIQLGRAALRNIHQNLFWAFCYNILAIPVAAGILYPFSGMLLNPMIAGLAMSLSSVCVVTNALRLRRA